MRSPVAVAALLFGSGFCALVYQTVWLRQFRLIFGASTAATAAVLAIFMAGLGVGSALLGRRADAKDKPLAFYGRLEIAIAISAALTPLLLIVVRAAYLATGGSTNLFIATVARLILSLLVLGVPTVLMGGTLPAAARAVESSEDDGRRRLALLYGLNTLGAVAGTIVSTFYLLERLGNRNTLFVAAALNVVIGVIAIFMDRGAPHPALRATLSPPERGEGRKVVFAAAFIAGFAFLVMELVWYRMLSPVLGGTTFMFGLILAIALAGIGLGGAAYSLWAREQATTGAFALTCALEALAMVIPFALGDEIAMLAVVLRPAGTLGFGGHLIGWTIVTTVVVFPAALIAGFQFPLLISLLGRGREHVGRDVGLAYAWNTAGSITGSLLGGFVLIPTLSAPGTWQLVTFVLAALSIVVLLDAFRARRFATGVVAVVIAGLAVAATGAAGPTALWRHSGIGIARFPVPASMNDARERASQMRRALVWHADGRESSVALMANVDLGLVINGKSDGSARGDAPTQIMGGLLPAMLHPGPRTACVVGLGTGTTAGWLAAVPTMQSVDVYEIEPAVVEIAAMYAPVNRDVLKRPNVAIHVADAREAFLARPKRYDVIFSEPSNPYRAGIASLYTHEFYVAARERLERGGIFAQWLQTYAVDAPTVRTVYATMRTAFPWVETWWTTAGDLLLIAAREPIVYDIDALRARLRTSPFREGAHNAWRAESIEGVLAHFAASNAFGARVSRGAALNTDDRTTIEFSFARSISSGSFSLVQVIESAQQLGHSRPERLRGAVDWNLVRAERAIHALEANPGPHGQFTKLFTDGDLRGAAELYQRRPWTIVNSGEVARVALALAEVGDERALRLADALRASEPIEADVITAHMLFRRNRGAEAAAVMERALTGYRTNPWPQLALMRYAISTTTEIALSNRALGEKLFAALEKPFVNLLFEDYRRQSRVRIAAQGGCSRNTVAALLELEPNAPWQREFLQLRAMCYRDELGENAKKDLAKFEASEPKPLLPR